MSKPDRALNLNRRAFLTSAAASALTRFPARAASTRPPNVLFIMTDQQSADVMSCRMGDQYLSTPHMDSLAEGGRVFSRAYCANPLCAPSRTSIFSGHYPPETRIETNGSAQVWTDYKVENNTLDVDRFPLMGTVFKRAGYDTGYFGKLHIPLSDGAPHGFDVMQESSIPLKKDDTDVAGWAVEFIRAKHDKPFLAVVSFVNPHDICQWSQRQRLPNGSIGEPPPVDQCPPRVANFAPPKGETDIMALMERSYHASKTFPVGNYTEEQWRIHLWAYYRMTEKVDALVGRVLGALRDAGIEDQTLVAYTADHGEMQGAHGWNEKTVFYEEAARVPLIISWKGVTKPGISRQLVHTGVEVLPTLCSYAGVTPPPNLPGQSLKETANGLTDADSRDYVVVCNKMVQGMPVDGKEPQPDGRMVRSQRYKYFVLNEGERRETLFDLEKDPGELVNLAAHEAHGKILALHRKMLAEWSRKIKDTFVGV